MAIPFQGSIHSPHPSALAEPVTAVVVVWVNKIMVKHIWDARNEVLELHQQWDQLVWEMQEVDKEWEHTSNWIADLIDQLADVRGEIWQMEQELKMMKVKERLEASGLGQWSGHADLVAPCSVSVQSQLKGASAVPWAPKKGK